MTLDRPSAGCRSAARRTTGALLVTVALASLTGCSGSSERAETRAAAARFVNSLSTPEAACALLAPGTRSALVDQSGSSCAAALAGEGLPTTPATVSAVSVAGHSAQVVLTGQVVFLARFDDGWKVTAAGCSRTTDDTSAPYDCKVKGD